MRFPSIALLFSAWFDLLQWVSGVLQGLFSALVDVIYSAFSLAITVIPSVFMSIFGMMGTVGKAIDAFAVGIVLSNFAFSIINRSITPVEPYKPVTQVTFANSGIYSKVFLIVILTGPVTAPLVQDLFPYLQRAVNELNCYLVIFVDWIVSIIGKPIADIYNFFVPDLNLVLAFIYAYAKEVFLGVADLVVIFF